MVKHHNSTVLEILRNNSKLEALYAMTAHKAFQFCKQYKRTTEFRRLCEIIRNHLANLNKYRDQRDRPDLSAPESLQLYLDTRFDQLKVATELGLWQLFSLQKNFNKNLSQKDLQLIASSVVLAALSVPPFDRSQSASHMELENEKERNLRMANLIGFNLEPKFEGRDMVSRGVLSCASQEVKDLFHVLEHEFHPLDLGSKIQPLLEKISKSGGKLSSAPSLPEVQLSQYVPSLEKLATLRLLQQVSKIYQTVRIESLSQLVPFFEFSVVEKISVDAVKNNFVAMKVDHMKGVVIFGNLGIESDGLKDHLAVFAESLNKVRAMLFPVPSKASKLAGILPNLADTVEKEHKRLLARKSIIEKRKEDQERQQLEMEREEEHKRLKLQRLTEEAEQKRLAAELQERRKQRILREIEEKELEEAQALLEDTEKRMKKGKKKTLLDGEKVTKQTVMERALSEQLKERQEMEKKLQKLAKTMDYLERAKREEAAPLIEAAYQRRLVEEREFYEREQQREVELSRERHESDLKEKNRLSRMLELKETFQGEVISRRQAEFDRIRTEREDRISQIIRARKQARDIKRKQMYYLTIEEERIRKLQEEEEARKLEEAEKRKKQEAEHKAKLDEIAEKQRQRERELEEKEKKRREELLKGTNAPPAEPAVATAAAPPTVAPASGAGKYVPRFKRQTAEASAPAAATPAAESDRWANRGPPPADDHWGSNRGPTQKPDRWTSGRERAGPPPAEGGDRWVPGPRGSDRPSGGDAWRSGEERRSPFGSSKPRPAQR
ncbi:hypothetical protein Bca4012_026841 [Brassica carinata]